MKIVITGGQGFLARKLAKKLLENKSINLEKLILVDVIPTREPINDQRVSNIQMDLHSGDLSHIFTKDITAIFHLAAIVSSQAEQEPDLGYQINFETTKRLLDYCRNINSNIRFIFSSSLAVYGGELPEIVSDKTVLTPSSTYGSQKAMCELLINDYSRKGFIDGLVLRLPTICIRPGKPNQAASSFVSSIIREPLKGENTICPVERSLKLWISSPNTVINNFIHALTLPKQTRNSINLPGLTVSVEDMLTELVTIRSEAILDLLKFEFDPKINQIVASWPAIIDCSLGLSLGFTKDHNFTDVIQQFIQYDL